MVVQRRSDGSPVYEVMLEGGGKMGSQVAERLGNRASNQKIAGSIPSRANLRPWARHLTLLASGECPCTYCNSLWIRVSAK